MPILKAKAKFGMVGASTIVLSCLISYDVNAAAISVFKQLDARQLTGHSIVHTVQETPAQRANRLRRSGSDGGSQNSGGSSRNTNRDTRPAPSAGGGAPPPVPARTYPGSNQPNNTPTTRPSAYDNVNAPIGGGGTGQYQNLPAGAGNAPPPVPARTYPGANQPQFSPGYGPIPVRNPSAPTGQPGAYDNPNSALNANGGGAYDVLTPDQMGQGSNGSARPLGIYDNPNTAINGNPGIYDQPTMRPQFTPGYGPIPERQRSGPTEVYSGVPGNGPTEQYSGVPTNNNYQPLPANADPNFRARQEAEFRARGITPVYNTAPNPSIGQYDIANPQPVYARPNVNPNDPNYQTLPLAPRGASNGGYQPLPANAGNGNYGPLPTTDGYQPLPANAGNGAYQSLPANANEAWRRQQEAGFRARGIEPVYGNVNNPSIGQYDIANPRQPVYALPNVNPNDPNYQTLPLAPRQRQNDGYQPLPANAGNGGYQTLPLGPRGAPNDGYQPLPGNVGYAQLPGVNAPYDSLPTDAGYSRSPPPNDGYQSLPLGAGYDQLPPPRGAQQNGGYQALPAGAGYAQIPAPNGPYQSLPLSAGYDQLPPPRGGQQPRYQPAPSQPANGGLRLPPPPTAQN